MTILKKCLTEKSDVNTKKLERESEKKIYCKFKKVL